MSIGINALKCICPWGEEVRAFPPHVAARQISLGLKREWGFAELNSHFVVCMRPQSLLRALDPGENVGLCCPVMTTQFPMGNSFPSFASSLACFFGCLSSPGAGSGYSQADLAKPSHSACCDFWLLISRSCIGSHHGHWVATLKHLLCSLGLHSTCTAQK